MQQFSTQDKEFRAFQTLEAHSSSIGILHNNFMIYKLSMADEVPLRQKEA
jgi:hypothetical protein